MFFESSRNRWQRAIRDMAPQQALVDHAKHLRDRRVAAARIAHQATEHLSNITAAYLDACRRAGVKPL